MRRPLFAAASAVLLALSLCASVVAAPDLRVRGNKLIDGPGRGHVVALRGVNRSGLEYSCISGTGFFESPHPYQLDTKAMIAAMKSWDINVVRVPLNGECWLGIRTPRGLGGASYQRVVKRYVGALVAAHLYVIVDLHWTAPDHAKALDQIPMADADNAPRFWRSVARTFKQNRALLFDVFNEPYGIGWGCWLHGCSLPAGFQGDHMPAYRVAGMQQLVNTIRATGAHQPLMIGGLSYALDLSQWLAHEPRDPIRQLVASEHNYGLLAPCDAPCRSAILATHRYVPVVFGELGETDCRHGYIDQMMPFADRHAIGYLGWAWDSIVDSGWSCTNGPALIERYDGTPSPYGVGFREHFRALGVPRRP